MLKRVGHPVDEKGAAVAIKDATFPVPFAPVLEQAYLPNYEDIIAAAKKCL